MGASRLSEVEPGLLPTKERIAFRHQRPSSVFIPTETVLSASALITARFKIVLNKLFYTYHLVKFNLRPVSCIAVIVDGP